MIYSGDDWWDTDLIDDYDYSQDRVEEEEDDCDSMG